MSDTTQCDIAIIGGGMVGAALASLLAKANSRWSITLVEAFALPAAGAAHFQPSFDDRSTAIAYGSVELLKQVGVWSQLAQYATPITQVHVSDKGHLGGALIDAKEVGVDTLGYVVPNAWIGRVLMGHVQGLANVSLRAPASVTQLRPVAGGAQIDVLDAQGQSTQLKAALAVIADGVNSGLRKSLGIDVVTEDYQQTAIIANISLDRPHRGIAYERFTDDGPMAMLPLGGSEAGQQSALVWTHPCDLADEIMGLSDEAFLAQLQQRFGYRLGQFTAVSRRDSYRLSLAVAQEQIRSSVVVMGNAAHFLHPVAGQGFNLAVRDCASLADALRCAGSAPLGSLAVLQDYMKQQALDQQATIHFSDQLTKLFSTSRLPQAGLRALGFVGLECIPPAKHWLAQQTMGNTGRHVVL